MALCVCATALHTEGGEMHEALVSLRVCPHQRTITVVFILSVISLIVELSKTGVYEDGHKMAELQFKCNAMWKAFPSFKHQI